MAHCGGGSASRRAQQQQQETSFVVESHFQGLLDDDDKYRALCGAFGYLQQQEWPDLSSACFAAFGAPPGTVAQEASNGGNSISCSGSASSDDSTRKRKPDAHPDAKKTLSQGDCKKTRGKQQLCDPDQNARAAGKGKPEKPRPCSRKKPEVATAAERTDYIHVRARRGQATDSHSLAERVRRERISERMRYLQELVPGCDKVTGKAGMLDEIINYVQSLQKQVEFLSMKIAASNPVVNFNIVDDLFGGRRLNHQPSGPAMTLPVHGQLDPSCLQMSTMPQMQQPPAAGFGLEMLVGNQYPQAQSAAATPVSVSAGASLDSCLDVNGAAVWDIGSQNLFTGFDAQFQSVQSDCLLDNLKMEM